MPAPSVNPADPAAYPPCVEHGTWTPIPRDPPGGAHLIKLKDIDLDASHRVKKSGVMSFHTVGCSGDFNNPPYSGAQNFAERGDPNLGPTPRRPAPAGVLLPLGNIIQQAFHESGQFPDVVLSAHAHHYQRITYTYAGGWQIPFVIAGSGGHAPVEKLSKTCSGETVPMQSQPFDAVLPPGIAVPKGDSVKVVAFNDNDFGFLRITVDANKRIVIGEFFTAHNELNRRHGS